MEKIGKDFHKDCFAFVSMPLTDEQKQAFIEASRDKQADEGIPYIDYRPNWYERE